MCGIGGYIVKKPSHKPEGYLDSCAAFMAERGPDQFGEMYQDNVGFVHKRLSIIDLSEHGRQPMRDASGQIMITFNGEIYNYREIKRELLQAGCSFRTETDTEVIIEGYKAWGIAALLRKLDGMFAFGLHDPARNVLVLARDPFGKKPLYLYEDDGVLLFSSDIRAIHSQVRSKLSLDLESVDYYLSELSIPQPKTIWKEVRQLRPGTFLEIGIHDGSRREETYFTLEPSAPAPGSLADAVAETEVLLRRAILKRMVADVPVGCFLSGGVDSGLIVSILASNTSERVKTFTIGFDGENNELPDARIVAERYGTDHHEVMITPDIIDDLPNLVRYVGEPFADYSLLPSYYVCKAMQGKLKVVLSGDGGDELFGGYTQYMNAFKADRFMQRHPNRLMAYAVAQGDKLLSRFQSRTENAGAYWHYSRLDAGARMSRDMGFSEQQKARLYAPGVEEKASAFYSRYMESLWQQNASQSLTGNLMKASLHTRLLNDYLVKVDRASMINSLEVRSPLLDKDLARFAFGLPDAYKFHGGHSKYILKELAAKYFEPGIFNKAKRGFSFPLAYWLDKGFRERIAALKSEHAALYRTGYFSPAGVAAVVDGYRGGDADAVNKVWLLLCLDEWCQSFL